MPHRFKHEAAQHKMPPDEASDIALRCGGDNIH
jgi:hypothetical protein